MKVQHSSAGILGGVITVARSQHICFVMLLAVVVAGYRRHLVDLIAFSFAQDQYSHIVLIPIISMVLVFRQRATIFAEVRWAVWPGMAMIVPGLAGTVLVAQRWLPSSTASIPAATACLVTVVIGIFTLCYGIPAVRAACFPVFLLLLMVPVPAVLLDNASLLLQKASCQLTYSLMRLFGTPVLQKGFVLSTPEGGIEVAEHCSGIRSTLGLLIGGLVASHLFLRSNWKKMLLAFSVIPVSVFKNALRIVTLYWLGVHADEHFLTGALHRYGGIPFSVLALGVLGPLLWVLRKSDALPLVAVGRHELGSRRAAVRPTVHRALSD